MTLWGLVISVIDRSRPAETSKDWAGQVKKSVVRRHGGAARVGG